MKEHSLISFTLLSQSAVGIFCIQAACFTWFNAAAGLDQAAGWCVSGFIVSAVLMLAAMILSFLHLGKMQNAWLTYAHFRTSWLSREIILVLAFTGLSLLVAALSSLDLPLQDLLPALIGLAALAGLALLYSMSRIYRQRTLPAWNTRHTPLQFYLTALATGLAGSSLVLALADRLPSMLRLPLMQGMGIVLAFILLLQVLLLVIWLNPPKRPGVSREPLSTNLCSHRQLLLSYFILAFLAILTTLSTFLPGWGDPAWLRSVVLVGVVLLVVAMEYLGRGLFYLARVRLGV
jgi:anaerobic dimethyl sulfoxide reductase subunit C